MARQLYETAFDSKVRREVEDIDKLVQSPVLSEIGRRRHSSGPRSGSAPSSSSGSSSNTPTHQPYLTARESPRRGPCQALPQFFHTEKRKVTLVRDSPRSSPLLSRNTHTGSLQLSRPAKETEFELKIQEIKHGCNSQSLNTKTGEKESSFTKYIPEDFLGTSKISHSNRCLVSTNDVNQKEKISNKLLSGSKGQGFKQLNTESKKTKSFETVSGSLDRKNSKTTKNSSASKLHIPNGALLDNTYADRPAVCSSMIHEKKLIKNTNTFRDSPKHSSVSGHETNFSKSFNSNFEKGSSSLSSKEILNNSQLLKPHKQLHFQSDQDHSKDSSKLDTNLPEIDHPSTTNKNVSQSCQPLISKSQSSTSLKDRRYLWNESELQLKSKNLDPVNENKIADESNHFKQGISCKEDSKDENETKDESISVRPGGKEEESSRSEKVTAPNDKLITRPKRPGSLSIPSLSGMSIPIPVRTQHIQSPPTATTTTSSDKDNTANKASTSKDSGVPNRPTLNLSLNLNTANAPKRARQQLFFSFGCPVLSAVGETVDPNIPLERQGWYHGSINRIDAEKLLRNLKEGSYLVRNSKSSKGKFSLSLKSAKGFMHMKIVHSDEKFILGQFGRPFDNVPEMVHHYSVNKLPIKGAEHMSLLHPVIDQLL
ncbi:mucin-4-like [Limulus polyphemus]|uniref:Mucin-4-like n=1 Tax=Limulus polyphemus TaxID=6850 RepID=A0ABM1THZ5_LIMPO|nr:mucin-4-like [Limulus polyphemus]XP_022255509.1 mucin-4-like [Limulus polyphemus]XP_022255516.1 mucin-4-like [Limulus polyphemus]